MRLIFLISTFFLSTFLSAQKKEIVNSSFDVKGVCIMCKKRIEKKTFRLKGIKHASWDISSNNFVVIYDSNRISLENIHKAIALSGHDTSKEKALDDTYNKLPDCCLYKRE